MLTETAPPLITPAMRDEMSRHMRLTTGFAEDQNEDVDAVFRAAVAHLESSLGLCLIPRAFVWLGRLGADGSTAAPIAPVRSLSSVARIGVDGSPTVLKLAQFNLDQEKTRTRIVARSGCPGLLQFVFNAGFGAEWSATPADLRRAVQMLAAHYFDNRQETGAKAMDTPYGVAALTQPWRPVRLGLRRSA